MAEVSSVLLGRKVIYKTLKNVWRNLSNNNNLNYCLNLVKKCDYESYLSTLLLRDRQRDGAFVLRALQVELSQIRDLVSDRQIGRMRLQFWKDAINNIYELIKRHDLSRALFDRILRARESQIRSDIPFSNIAELERVSIATSPNTANDDDDNNHKDDDDDNNHDDVILNRAVGHLGKAQGIITLLRAIPHNAAKNIVYIPVSLMMKTPINLYLKSLERCDFNPLNPKLQLRNSWLPIVLLINRIRLKI
ncbi:hypothetical protein HELRODRAFT_179707 [Helobdella robusta]|uniref:Uncharacterized protein n=1 Tax=Helobdella robusta TaxID=6412 RepID=T1FF18_HELRO|nr:hypothetical protein HELRODRAFT_179707 [Helobdella robusta]ESN95114.1 hypothetical protein HELRODRAFT_179707 [Helobdella robusta]